tara:strand:- start:333 stop:602 length:270 start_codon:yes stop_codon:yes gene_type:complete
MATVDDHAYLKVCAELASCLSISLAAARRKVELVVASKGIKGLEARQLTAEDLLKEALSNASKIQPAPASQLDKLLTALAEEENFMIED